MDNNNMAGDWLNKYSFGTIPLYNQLYKLLVDHDDYDTILINLSTICRNVTSQNKAEYLKRVKNQDIKMSDAIEALSKMVLAEVQTFLVDAAHLLSRSSPVPLAILTYQYDYADMIPTKFLHATKDEVHHGTMARLSKTHVKGKLSQAKYQKVNLYDTYLNGNNVIDLLDGMIHSVPNQHNVIHISHHPIDYHVAMRCNRWTSVKSYTGAIWNRDELGLHVFQKNLPYLHHLHILLGDKTDLIHSLPNKEIEKLSQIAQDESWYLLPEDKIEERLRQLSYLTPYTF